MEVSNHTGNYIPFLTQNDSDKPYSNLKPGQKQLDRDYYGKATHEQPNGQACLTNYGRFDSIYNQNIAATVKPGDFKVPSKNANTMGKPLYS